YTSPLPTPDVEMIVYGPAPLHRKLQVVTGKFHWHPKTKQQGYDKFPQYFIVRVDGLDEVFEQRRRDDILYITDDPKEMATIKK
ncbi:MAG TPA: hypothetical protein VK445_11010, partial [Dissulfurispiraceae bacterium]|nr:hypothetical protein [Dissulfurispiraceae bacterium]